MLISGYAESFLERIGNGRILNRFSAKAVIYGIRAKTLCLITVRRNVKLH
jgi:hypothetical protein